MVTARSRLTFGKHRGKRLGDVPVGYLRWMATKLREGDFHEWAALADQVLRARMASGEVQTEEREADLEEQADQFLRQHGVNPRRAPYR